MCSLTNEGNVNVLESCVDWCSDSDMSRDGIHGRIAWDGTAWPIAVVHDELDVWLAHIC